MVLRVISQTIVYAKTANRETKFSKREKPENINLEDKNELHNIEQTKHEIKKTINF